MKYFLFSVLLLIVNQYVHAGSITAELDRNETTVGEPAYLSVTISGSLKGELTIPDIDGLQIASTGTSTNVQIVNGSFSKETSYNFAVIPERNGDFQIPSFKVTIDGESLSTLPLKLKVGIGGATGPPQTQQRAEDEGTNGNETGPIFIERILTKSDLYEGEAVLSKIRIFHRVRLLSLVPEKDPAPAWRVIAKEGQKTYETTRNGMQWRVLEVNEVLIPLKQGQLALPSYGVRATYVQPSSKRRRTGTVWDLLQNGVFDMGEETSKRFDAPSKQITVKPLPQNGRPAVVSDIVGDFKLSVDVSKKVLNPGETSTVTIKITGMGALDRMQDVSLKAQSGTKIYADKPAFNESISEDGLSSSKEFKFAVVPSTPGPIDLGDVTLGVFNPRTEQWQTLKQDIGDVEVKGTISKAEPSTGGAAETVPVPTAPRVAPESSPKVTLVPNENAALEPHRLNLRSAVAIAIAVAGFGVFVGLVIWVLRIYRHQKKSKKPTKRFKALHQKVKDLQSGNDVHKVINWIKTELATNDQSIESMTSQDVVNCFRGRMPETLERSLVECLSEFDAYQYRGVPYTRESLERFKSTMIELADVSFMDGAF